MWSGSVRSLVAVLATFAVLVAACAPAPAPQPTQAPAAKPAEAAKPAAKTAVISAVTAFVKDDLGNDGFWELSRRLEQKSGGSLKIEWKGGPEAIPSFEAVAAVQRGVVDLVNVAASYYTQLVPVSTSLSNLLHGKGSFKGVRDSGVFDLMAREHQEKAGVKLLGASTGGFSFHLYTRKPVAKVADFRGLKIRTTPQYVPFLEALGAAPVTTTPNEVYTALERGVVDGFGWPRGNLESYKLQEVICCVIEPGFHSHWNLLVMSQQAWDRLSPEHQKVLQETMLEVEEWAPKYFWGKADAELQRFEKEGKVKPVQLPEAEAKAYRELAYSASWAKWVPTLPEPAQKIKELADSKGISSPWPVIRP